MYCLTLDLAPGYQLMSLDGATAVYWIPDHVL